ncbi:MAG: hypothetical protein AMJ79_09315 [Phycisphaerae bacterium SM23_30]|nr:MAG: hypothetical protein AMJ79_09315 [Phycisphaerae bacterium SM23_30]
MAKESNTLQIDENKQKQMQAEQEQIRQRVKTDKTPDPDTQRQGRRHFAHITCSGLEPPTARGPKQLRNCGRHSLKSVFRVLWVRALNFNKPKLAQIPSQYQNRKNEYAAHKTRNM